MAVQHWSANRCANLRFAKCLLAPGEGNCCSTFRLDISLFVNYVICMASEANIGNGPALTLVCIACCVLCLIAVSGLTGGKDVKTFQQITYLRSNSPQVN